MFFMIISGCGCHIRTWAFIFLRYLLNLSLETNKENIIQTEPSTILRASARTKNDNRDICSIDVDPECRWASRQVFDFNMLLGIFCYINKCELT